jgi:uncharacterized phage protein gp47/JayE
MAWGVTATGFVLKRLEDIKAAIEAECISRFGANIDLAEDQPLGQLISIVSEQIALDWEAMQAVYNALSPTSASGVALDRIAAINNIARRIATFSTGELTATGVAGTVIPSPTFVGGTSAGGRVVAVSDTVIGGGGTVTVPVRAQTAGDVTYAIGTVTEIVTPIFGLTSITNAAEITGGQDTETDEEFRIRRLLTLQNAGSSNIEGIRNALLAFDYVINAVVVENTLDVPDGDGRPGHSIECYILTDLGAAINTFPTQLREVTQAIWDAKPAGIETVGDFSDTITDSQSLTHTVYVSEAVEVPITLSFTVTENTNINEGDIFPTDGEDLIKAALVAYVAGLNIGQDVWKNKIESTISSIAGVKGISVFLMNGADANLTIAVTELATLSAGDITITVV